MRTEPKAGNTFRSHIPPGDLKKALEWVDRFTDEGAACFTLQPIMPNIDLFIHVRAHTSLPLCAYSVSTELGLGCDHERRMREDQAEVIGEYYSGLLRAGADQIMSYIAPAFARWLNRRDTTGH
jgi:delta-aminolevulinic acid dehydratase/porphobilinogen synthase